MTQQAKLLVVGGVLLGVACFVAGRVSVRCGSPTPTVVAVLDAGVQAQATAACDAGPPPIASCTDKETIRWLPGPTVYLPGDAGSYSCPEPVITEEHTATATGSSASASASASGAASAGATFHVEPSLVAVHHSFRADLLVGWQPVHGNVVLGGELAWTPGDFDLGVWGTIPPAVPSGFTLGVEAGGRFGR